MKLKVARLAVLLTLLLNRCASGQANPLASKHWDLSIWASGATGEEKTNSFAEAQIWSLGVTFARALSSELGSGWRRGNIEYGAAFIPYFATARSQSVHGWGVEPAVLRWNFTHLKRDLTPYIELRGGGLFANGNLPPGDTSSFNFTVKGGGGFAILTGKRQFLDLGCHWSHISNANLGVRNPEFNGIAVSIGYHWIR